MALMWLAVLVAALLPLVALLFGVLRLPRDYFAGLMYLQALVYLLLAPATAATELPVAIQTRYTYFLLWAVPLFCLPFLVVYRWRVSRGPERVTTAASPLVVRLGPSCLFVAGSIVLALGYLWVALSRNLLYRRLGWEGLASAQLDLSLLEFAFYRTFIEFAPFLAAFSLAVLRLARVPTPGIRTLWRACLGLVGSIYGLHVLVNSRVWGVLFLSALAGLWWLTSPPGRRIRPERGVLALLLLLAGLYLFRVTENVRARINAGGSPLDPANLLPTAPIGGGEEAYWWRLNGVDLMTLIADNLEAQGPALGRAWAVPLLLSLDPIVRTDLTEQLKRATFTNAKSFLLLQYAGIAVPDYYSCMVSDAYGNLGLPGFVVVALVLGSLCAVVARGLRPGTGPVRLVLACFILTRILPFEQEFSTLVFGWFKLVPLVAGVLLVNPLARAMTPHGATLDLVGSLPASGTA